MAFPKAICQRPCLLFFLFLKVAVISETNQADEMNKEKDTVTFPFTFKATPRLSFGGSDYHLYSFRGDNSNPSVCLRLVSSNCCKHKQWGGGGREAWCEIRCYWAKKREEISAYRVNYNMSTEFNFFCNIDSLCTWCRIGNDRGGGENVMKICQSSAWNYLHHNK